MSLLIKEKVKKTQNVVVNKRECKKDTKVEDAKYNI